MKILMISYISKEIEGRLKRHYDYFSKIDSVEVILLQFCRNEKEKTNQKNVINIMQNRKSKNKYFYFVKIVKDYLKNHQFDFIFLNNYYTAIFTKKRLNIIYDSYELYYPGCGRKLSLRDKFFYHFERKALKNASIILSASQERSLVMVGAFKLNSIPLFVENMPISISKLNANYNKEDAIVYTGYLSPERNIDKFIISLKQYNKYNNPIRFDIYGVGVLENYIKENLCDDNIKYCGKYKNDDLKNILPRYRFAYIGYSNQEINTILCSPNKLLDYIEYRNIVISNDNYTLMNFIKKHKIGVAGSDFLKNIDLLVTHADFYANSIEKFISDYDNSASYKNLFDKMEEFLNDN